MDASVTSQAPALVPELLVTDLQLSLAFWRDLCGFVIAYERVEEGFAYITRGNVHVMLEQQGIIRNWVTAPLERPLGRGINFQISVAEIGSLVSALRTAGQSLFMEPETCWYRIDAATEVGVEQFLVADPDGYLIRFQCSLGQRQISGSSISPE